jgi:serine/threonine protein phosphatase 1
LLNRLLADLFRPRQQPDASVRQRLSSQDWPAVIYAIGDVHGCLAQLQDLTAQIVADAADIAGEKWIVMLGDYIDRGPDSAGVIEVLLAPAPAGFRRICLTGNHETLMLEFIDSPSPTASWLRWGGLETLGSYGIAGNRMAELSRSAMIAVLTSHVPDEHLRFLRELPVSLSLPGVIFVHAGLRPGVPLEQQRLEDLLWIREPFLSAPGEPGQLVVHGHTPGLEPEITQGRIGIDTGAFQGGPLTAVRLQQGRDPIFLFAWPPP